MARHFQDRFSSWAAADLRREIESDFPLLNSVKSELSARFVNFAREIGSNQLNTLMNAMIKHFHGKSSDGRKALLTSEERRLLEELWNTDFPAESSKGQWNCAEMRRLVDTVVLSLPAPFSSSSWVRGEREVIWHVEKNWTLETRLDTNSKASKLWYDHVLVNVATGERVRTSILHWLGIAAQTEWTLAASPIDAAVGFERVVKHFHSQLPALLS